MDTKVENGQDTGASERKRAAINLSAPDVRTRAADAGEGPARSAHNDEPTSEPSLDNRSRYVDIEPRGRSAVFGTSLKGYTLFHMHNLGDDEADVSLTWLGPRTPELARMYTNRKSGCEVYRDEFYGAKVAITNLSQDSVVRIRVTLCP